MFLNNKYTKTYFKMINSGFKNKPNHGYYERHNIIPKSIGGANSESNLTYLTARQHFLCHLLLLKMTTGNQKKSMAFAYFGMRRSNSKKKGGRYDSINSKLYEKYRKTAAKEISGENNPFYGKGYLIKGKNNPMYGKPCYYNMNEEEKQTWKNNISKGTLGDKNPFYRKTHTEEFKKKMRGLRVQPIKVFFKNNKIKTFEEYGDLGDHLNMSRYLGSKLCKPNNFHLLDKYEIKKIERIVKL